MLSTLFSVTASNDGVNYTLIVVLTIIISLPFIISSIVIPILLAVDKHKKKQGKISKTKSNSVSKKDRW